MLIQFRVGNYLSFKDAVTFSMVASDEINSPNSELDKNNVFSVDDELSLLKSSAIYGANASGKSNLIKALSFMRWFVINSSRETQAGELIGVRNFKLCTENKEKPSLFEITFILEEKIYRYGFEVDNHKVVAEWLFYTPNQKEYKCFERSFSQFDISKRYFKEGQLINTKTRDNSLFISTVAQFNGFLSQKILLWFQRFNVMVEIDDSLVHAYRATIEYFENNEYKCDILKLIKKLDLGIEDLFVEEAINHNTLNRIIVEPRRKRIKTIHKMYDAKSHNIGLIEFDFDEESEGTQKIFAFSGLIINTLKNGRTLVVDELDARLHPLMTRAIIELFNSRETNPKNAQLISTTHDTNLLNDRLFRLDQIWFTEKNNLGATDLYSLAEYQIENDSSLEQDYIKGKYGAIPFIGNLHQLFSKN
jgi:uncharacterized protein